MNVKAKRVLIADDEEPIRRLLDFALRREGFVTVSAADGVEAMQIADEDLCCALVDLKMPRAGGMEVLHHFQQNLPDVPVVLMSAVGQIADAVKALKAGAADYVAKPFDLEEAVAVTYAAARLGGTLRENRGLRQALTGPMGESMFLGDSLVAQRLRDTVEKVANLDGTVLLTGESGVGKNLVARIIHRTSRRAGGACVHVNCPAVPRDLLASEMFGHERGAFTGAHERRLGKFEMANGGTLLLDEIGELPLLLQPTLLSVLQERQFTRVGGSKTIDVDVRVIALTNAELEQQVEEKTFRADLYYRLNVLGIHIPPVRERLEDLPVLCRAILQRIGNSREADTKQISNSALAALAGYSWPGNVRELENVLERATAFCAGGMLETCDLPPPLGQSPVPSRVVEGTSGEGIRLAGMSMEEIERLAVQQTLQACKGNKREAARMLGVTEKTVYNKTIRFGLG